MASRLLSSSCSEAVATLTALLCLPLCAAAQPAGPVTLRIATFNLGDVRAADLKTPDNARLKRLADVIQHLRPNVILLNEIACDAEGEAGEKPGSNAQRFADRYLAIAQSPDTEPLHFTAFMAPTNSGVPSGLDLDKNGRVVTIYPAPIPPRPDGSSPELSPEALDYAADCWGSGTFPGQHGMALLIDSRLTLLPVRTFRLLPWDYMPGAAIPPAEDGKGDWYPPETRKAIRLSSTSHWDAPVKLPNGAILHLLCSHPVAPAPDSPERRNARRNHDEIRFWSDYIQSDTDGWYIVDDLNKSGGLADDAPFVILGDLNADPQKGATFKNPVTTILFTNRRVNTQVTPRADIAVPGLDATDTATSKLRTDYVLPSRDIAIVAAGVWRHPPDVGAFPSSHFPVWMDIRIRPPQPPPAPPRPNPNLDR